MSRRAATYKLLRRHWPLLIPALFTVSVFHAWFAPGLILGADWVRRVPDELNGYFPWPHVWNHAQQLGENDSYYFNYLPLFSLIGLCSRLQGSWNVIERIFFLWPYVAVSVFCPYVFLVRVTRSPYASAIGTCMWCINTWIIMAAERGAIPSLVAASLLPLFFLFALRFIERPRMVRGIGLAALLTAISLYDLRYVYIAIFFALVLASEQLLKDRSWKRAITAIPALLVACITTLILNLYWIIQQFFEATNPGAGYGTVLDYILNSHFMTPQHALAGFAVFYHWVASNDPFTPTNPDWYFFLIPVFTFVVYSLVWKRRWVWSLSIGYAVSMLLLCGPSWPVDKINIWIFAHVPGMMLFRDVTKWMSLLIISYSTVISMGIARFIAYTRLKLGAGRVMMTAPLLTGALAVCYALMMNDAYSPIRYRVFYTYNMHSDVVALERYLQSRPGHPRSLIFPRDIEPMRAISSHPYVEGLQIENSASPDGLRHLNLEWDSLYGFFSSPFAPDMLREMNVDYVVVPYDYDKVIYQGAISNWTFYDALQFMQSRPWLEFDRRIGRQYVFRMRDPMRAKAFIAPDPFVMNGGGATLAALVGTPLVNDRMAFLLPDQPLPNIWRRIPNYVGGAWPIDTNLAKIGKARLDVYAGERLARAAKSGRFVFTAAGVSTASGIPNLYSGDGPTLFDTHSATPGSGSATFSINLSDISTLNQTMFETRSFERSVSELSYAGADILYEPATREQATVTYVGRNRRDGIVEVQNGIGVALIADVNLSQLKIPIPFTATFEGKVATCPSDCTLRAVLWRPGVNRIVLHFALSKAQAAILRGTTFEAMLASQRPMSLPVTKTVTLLSGVSIPLRLRPYVDFRYGPLASNAAAMIYLRLRSTEDGRIVWYADELPQTGIYAQQLQYAINDALHVQFERLLDRHRFDYAWLAKNRLADEPDGAGLYDITAVMVSASPRIVPKQITFLATPSWPQLAAGDDRQPTDVRAPSSLRVSSSSGMRVVRKVTQLPGYFAYSFENRRAARRSSTFEATVPVDSQRFLDFMMYQPGGYSLSLRISGPSGQVFSDTLTPPDGNSYAAGSTTVVDGATVAWPIGTPHCVPQPCGAGATPPPGRGLWKHVQLNLGMLGLRSKPLEITFKLDQIPGQNPTGSQFAISTRDGEKALAAGNVPAVLLDDEALRYSQKHTIPALGYQVLRGKTTLSRAPAHRMNSIPIYPLRPVSMALMQGRLRTFRSATIRNGKRVTPEEYIGDINSPQGLLVFDESWDPDWVLAIVPKGFQPTGFALLDLLRSRQYALPPKDHYRVNDILNGWWIPRGNLRVFMLMRLQAYSDLAGCTWIVASALWFAFVIPFARRFDART